MKLLELVKELALCKKRLQERIEEANKLDSNSLTYDILLMEIELLRMLISNAQGLIERQMKIRLTSQTRKAVFAIKSTIN